MFILLLTISKLPLAAFVYWSNSRTCTSLVNTVSGRKGIQPCSKSLISQRFAACTDQRPCASLHICTDKCPSNRVSLWDFRDMAEKKKNLKKMRGALVKSRSVHEICPCLVKELTIIRFPTHYHSQRSVEKKAERHSKNLEHYSCWPYFGWLVWRETLCFYIQPQPCY